MRKGKFMALFASVLCLHAYAQQDDYKLDRYVNPDFKRQSLDFNFGTNGSFSSQKQTGAYGSDDWDSQHLSGNLNLGYNRIKNSEKVQSRMNAGILSNGLYLDDEQSDTNNKGYSIELVFSNSAYYYMNDKKFIEFSPSAQFLTRNSKASDDDDTQTAKQNDLYTFVNFSLGIGKGRIEHVEDARQAIFYLICKKTIH